MKKRCLIAGQTTLVVLACAASAFAQGKSATNQGSTPNGKPFQQIQADISGLQTQINDLNAQTAALRAHVASLDANLASVVTDLRAELDVINGRLASLEGRVTNVEGQVSSLTTRVETVEQAVAWLNGRVDANTDSIAALQAANADLNAQLVSVRAEITSATGFLLGELNRIANDLQTQINTNFSNITALTNQTNNLQTFLNNMANYDCASGQAVQGIGPTGIVVCTPVGASGGTLQSFTAFGVFYLGGGSSGNASYQCPQGYTAVGGYSHWPYTDYQTQWVSDQVAIPYTNYYFITEGSGVWTGDAGWQYVTWGYYYPSIGYNSYDYGRTIWTPFRSSVVTQDYSWGRSYSIAATSQSGYYNSSNDLYWFVNCLRVA